MPDSPAGRIFISYRREETAYAAGWLFNRLADAYGRDQIFKDVDSIELGDDFVEVLSKAVGSTDVLLALIGGTWITVPDGEGKRRLDDPHDFVRIEIEAALTRGIKVIPILVDGATMPRDDDLPPSLAALARRQALELSPSRFEFDTSRLLRVLDKTLADLGDETRARARKAEPTTHREKPPAPRPSGEHPSRLDQWRQLVVRRWRVLAGVGVAILLGVVGIVVVATRSDNPSPAPPGATGGGSSEASSFVDDFSDKQHGWENVGRSDLGGRYRNGSYLLTGAREDAGDGFNTVVVSPANEASSEDVRIKVDARMTGGTASFGRAYGIYCRGSGSETLYAFTVWKNGAEIGKNTNGQYERISEVDSGVTSQPGEPYKQLEAVCRTSTQGDRTSAKLDFWVDGTKILTATDPSDQGVGNALLDGRYGLQTTFGPTGSAGETLEVEFDNFEVSPI